MATAAQKQELLEKVGTLVADKFAGDYHQAFQHYDNNQKDGRIDKDELVELLKDAGFHGGDLVFSRVLHRRPPFAKVRRAP